jgi:glycosyltransferase involved in cell wall biosynthesis
MDYHLPLIDHPKYLGLIPNPINTDKLAFLENPIQNKIVIFHGINRGNFYKKGNDLFQKAIQIIQEKYPDNTEIIVVENLPYAEYIKFYDKAHILLDQVYAYDQGYNALEAMAKGKVVFTGAEKEFLEHYNLQEDEVCINALPDVDALVEKLSWLIENPEEISRIGQNARAFIEREHHYIKIAEHYLESWNLDKV